MRRGERRKGLQKFWKNDDKKTDEMDRKECRKMMKTNKGRRWKMKKNVGWGVCMKQFICGAWPSTTDLPPPPPGVISTKSPGPRGSNFKKNTKLDPPGVISKYVIPKETPEPKCTP